LKKIHIGIASLLSSSSSFILDKILVVPQITKNLLPIQKFAQDNNVYFEFHNSFFLLKDYLGDVLHKGSMSDGLYCFSPFLQRCFPFTFVGAQIFVIDWHSSLGHASYGIV